MAKTYNRAANLIAYIPVIGSTAAVLRQNEAQDTAERMSSTTVALAMRAVHTQNKIRGKLYSMDAFRGVPNTLSGMENPRGAEELLKAREENERAQFQRKAPVFRMEDFRAKTAKPLKGTKPAGRLIQGGFGKDYPTGKVYQIIPKAQQNDLNHRQARREFRATG
jgi:hypothetical protein